MISDQRKRRLAAVARAHDEWEQAHASHRIDAARAAARRDGSDYNLHDLDVDPPPGAEEHFRRLVARHLAARAPGQLASRRGGITPEDILAEWHKTAPHDLAAPHLNRAAAALHHGDQARAAGELELAADHSGDSETAGRLCRMAMSLARERATGDRS